MWYNLQETSLGIHRNLNTTLETSLSRKLNWQIPKNSSASEMDTFPLQDFPRGFITLPSSLSLHPYHFWDPLSSMLRALN